MNIHNSVSGHFDICVRDAITNKQTRALSFDNMITDIGLRTYCGSGEIRYGANNDKVAIVVGKGINEPTPSDSTLESFFARSGEVSFSNFAAGTAPDYVSSCKASARFNAGTFNGDNLTEIGVAGNSNLLWCRARILDELGQPTALTVLSNEYLDVTYTLYYHPILTDASFSFELAGNTYNCTARAARVGNLAFRYINPLLSRPSGIIIAYGSQTLGSVTSEPSTSDGIYGYPEGKGAGLAWDSSQPFSMRSSVTIELDECNFADGIGAMFLATNSENGAGIYAPTQVSFSPKLPKDANTKMSFVLSRSISRYTP